MATLYLFALLIFESRRRRDSIEKYKVLHKFTEVSPEERNEKLLECCIKERILFPGDSVFKRTKTIMGRLDELYGKYLRMETEKLEEKNTKEQTQRILYNPYFRSYAKCIK